MVSICLYISPRAHRTCKEINKFYNMTKMYVIENEYVENEISTVDFATTNVYNVGVGTIVPLHSSVNSTSGTRPIEYEPFVNSSTDKSRSFEFNKQAKRYVYIAEGSPLAYNFSLGNNHSLAVRAYTDCNADNWFV